MQFCRWRWISNLGPLGLSHLAAHQGLFAPLKSNPIWKVRRRFSLSGSIHESLLFNSKISSFSINFQRAGLNEFSTLVAKLLGISTAKGLIFKRQLSVKKNFLLTGLSPTTRIFHVRNERPWQPRTDVSNYHRKTANHNCSAASPARASYWLGRLTHQQYACHLVDIRMTLKKKQATIQQGLRIKLFEYFYHFPAIYIYIFKLLSLINILQVSLIFVMAFSVIHLIEYLTTRSLLARVLAAWTEISSPSW